MNTFDKHCAALLNACGYTEQRYPESWEDVGDAENGPMLRGGPAYAAWTNNDIGHEIIVMEGQIVYDGDFPPELTEEEESTFKMFLG